MSSQKNTTHFFPSIQQHARVAIEKKKIDIAFEYCDADLEIKTDMFNRNSRLNASLQHVSLFEGKKWSEVSLIRNMYDSRKKCVIEIGR